MAMLITKFHSLIRNRLLWAAFLVIIVFTFVIWGTTTSGSKDQEGANSAGKLDGEYVPMEEFRRAYFSTYMSIVLNVGRPLNVTAELDRQIKQAAWRRLAALRQAEALGLTANNDEVIATIRGHQGFQYQGQFSPQHYQAFVQNVLNRLGFAEVQFEEHVRQEIALQKLQYMVQQAVLVTPYEINRAITTLSDTFEAEYVAIGEKDVEDEVRVGETEARALFLKDPALFTIPEKVSLRYVALPLTNYTAAVTVAEEDALVYYDDFMDSFVRTNRVRIAADEEGAEPPAEDEEAAWSNEIVQLTFDEVKTSIVERMTMDRARDKAVEAATELVIRLAPDREGQALTFEDVMAKAGLTIRTAGPFAANEPVEGVDAGLEFNRAAFTLRDTPDEYFSDAVVGSNAVYVLALTERFDARVPEFEEVSEDVLKVARQQAIAEAITKKAQSVREVALAAQEAKGPSFANAAESFKLDPVRVGPFSLTEGLDEQAAYSEELLRTVLLLNEGEVSEPIVAEDAVLVIRLAKRSAGETTELEPMREQIADSIRRQRNRTLFSEWQEYLLRAGRLEDRMAVPDEEMPADEEDLPEEAPAPDAES